MDLLSGQLPRRVHVHVTRYAAGQVPTTFVGLERWIQELWRDKEARLDQFYKDRVQFQHHSQLEPLPCRTKTLQVTPELTTILLSPTRSDQYLKYNVLFYLKKGFKQEKL